MIEIKGPDGVIYEFPDGTSDSVIGAAMRQVYGAPQQQAEAPPLTDTGMPAGMVMNPVTGQIVDMGSPNNPYVREGRGRAAMQGLGQGLAFGGMDEAVAGAYGLTGPGSFDENRAWANAVMDEELRRAREQHPVAAHGAELAGGVATGLAATGGIAPAMSLKAKLAQAIGIGGGTGAVYGGLSSEGDRAMGALRGAGIGAATGALAVPAEWGLRRVGGTIGGALANISGKAKPNRARTAIAQAIAGSGRTPAQLADDVTRAARQGQDVFALADALGTPGQRALSGTARLGGAARREVTEALESRQAGQGERIAQMLADALGERPQPGHAGPTAPIRDTAKQMGDALDAARSQAAVVNYGAARQSAGPVNLTGTIDVIDDLMKRDPLIGDTALAKTEMGRRLAGLRGKMTNDSQQLIDFDQVLNVKQDLGRVIDGIKSKGEAVPHDLARVYGALDSALEASSPDYRAANDAFRRASREIDQIKAGSNAATPSRRAEDVVAEYGGLMPREQASYRTGYADRALGKIEGAAVGVDKSRPFTSPKSQTELGAMARDPDALAEGLARERTMFETRRQAIGGSQTADNLADMEGVGNLVRRGFNPIDMAATGAEWISRMSKGQNDATRALLARMLMSTGDDAAANIAQAVRRGEQLSREQQLALQTIIYLQQNGALQAAR